MYWFFFGYLYLFDHIFVCRGGSCISHAHVLQLTLRAVNSSRSAFACFLMSPLFFQRYQAPSDQAFRCKMPIKVTDKVLPFSQIWHINFLLYFACFLVFFPSFKNFSVLVLHTLMLSLYRFSV